MDKKSIKMWSGVVLGGRWAQGRFEGVKMEPNGPTWSQKGTEREPKAARMEPMGDLQINKNNNIFVSVGYIISIVKLVKVYYKSIYYTYWKEIWF